MFKMFREVNAKLIIFTIAIFLAGSAAGVAFYSALSAGVAPDSGNIFDIAAESDDSVLSAEGAARVQQLGKYLQDNYYLPVTDGAIETGILRGIFSSPGDPYTAYYTKDEFDETMERTHGELSGVGLTLSANKDGFIEVMGVVEGSPADGAGIRKGDLLISVDGTGYSGEQLAGAVGAAQGEPGTEVVLGISRNGAIKDYKVTRAVFVTPSVAHEYMKNAVGKDIGYIRVSSFNDNTATDFETALKEMNDKDGLAGIVIDVRGNAGGLVDKAIEMDDMLLDKGVICYAENGKGDRIEYATEDGKLTDLPYAVLIDGTSVSAAEIFALGVKAGGGGKLVGETTYGKGLIQKLEKFDEGDGVRITIMQYVAPDGEPVNGVGIAPDIEAPQPEGAEQGADSDAQLRKALSLF
ncbi:MAG: S41 family peptidase [Clostridiales Family XIII bacterium]|jgi:carboxyl-terminal processing protease|nr:S41 family peptidase [Clostridiales Family XIII bacterium]